jgi:hypothetical protein
MLMLALFRLIATAIPWTLRLATWMLARSLNLPQPLVHDAGVFMFAQVQTIENGIGKALWQMRLMRRLRSLLQR